MPALSGEPLLCCLVHDGVPFLSLFVCEVCDVPTHDGCQFLVKVFHAHVIIVGHLVCQALCHLLVCHVSVSHEVIPSPRQFLLCSLSLHCYLSFLCLSACPVWVAGWYWCGWGVSPAPLRIHYTIRGVRCQGDGGVRGGGVSSITTRIFPPESSYE